MQIDIIKDARGVDSATFFRSNNYNLLSKHKLKYLCEAVIGRYDQSTESATLVNIANDMLSGVIDGGFVIQVSDIKKMCEYMLNNNVVDKSKLSEDINIHNS